MRAGLPLRRWLQRLALVATLLLAQGVGVAAAASPGVVSRAPGVLEVFTRNASSGALEYKTWTASGGWTATMSLGGILSPESDIGVLSRSAEHLSVFVRGSDNALYEQYWTAAAGWSGWINHGGILTGGPSAVSWDSSRQDIFVRGSGGNVIQRTWTAGGSWGGWVDLGGQIAPGTGPAASSRAPGYVDVAVTGTDRRLYVKSFRPDTGWFDWYAVGGWLAGGPGIASQRGAWNGRQDYVGVTSTNGVAQMAYVDGGFVGWADLGGGVPSDHAPAPIWWQDAPGVAQRFDVFAYGTDGGLYQRTWIAGWGPWVKLTAAAVSNAVDPDEEFGDDVLRPDEPDDSMYLDDDLTGTAAGAYGPKKVRIRLAAADRWATVRNQHGAYMVGNIPNGTTATLDRKFGASHYGGFINGSVQRCGWIVSKPNRIITIGTVTNAPCAGSSMPTSVFSSRFNKQYKVKDSSGRTVLRGGLTRVTVQVANTPMYANVRPWKVPSEVQSKVFRTYGVGACLEWRYVSRDGKYVAVLDRTIDNDKGRWGFIPLSGLKLTTAQLPEDGPGC